MKVYHLHTAMVHQAAVVNDEIYFFGFVDTCFTHLFCESMVDSLQRVQTQLLV